MSSPRSGNAGYTRSAEYRPILADRWTTRFRPVSAAMDITRDVPFEMHRAPHRQAAA